MDTNKVALTVSVVALFLTIPLSIVGNLLTPRVRTWYSTTNQKRLLNRIEQLQYRLFQTHREWTFSPAEWEMYRFTAVTVLSVIAFITFGFCILSSGGLAIYTEAKSIADPSGQ